MSSLQTVSTLGGRSLERSGFTIRENTEVGLLRLQTFGRTLEVVNAVRNQVGLPLPGPGEYAGDTPQFYWVGPGQWIVGVPLGAEGDSAESLCRHVGNIFSVVTVITDSRVVLDVTGDDFRQVLARGSSVDFHESRFSAGACVTTNFAGVAVMIACGVEGDGARLVCDRSFGAYLLDWLSQASFR